MNDWVLSEERIHALDSMGHNWWSVCVAMAGLAAVSLLDDVPEAAGWVERVTESFPEWFGYQGNILQNKSPNFDGGGAFYESGQLCELCPLRISAVPVGLSERFSRQCSAPDPAPGGGRRLFSAHVLPDE